MSPDPRWQSFDPSEDGLPSSLRPSDGVDVTGVVVVAEGPGLDDRSWGGETAVRLAREWARAGRRVFLADLSLDEPILHRHLGEENGEGMSDALLYGMSVRSVAKAPAGAGFYFASAGTVVADPASVLEHSRWDTLAGGFRGAGATFLLYVPTALVGSSRLLERADRLLLLRGEDADPAEIESDERTLAVLGPESGSGGAVPAAEEPPAAEGFGELSEPFSEEEEPVESMEDALEDSLEATAEPVSPELDAGPAASGGSREWDLDGLDDGSSGDPDAGSTMDLDPDFTADFDSEPTADFDSGPTADPEPELTADFEVEAAGGSEAGLAEETDLDRAADLGTTESPGLEPEADSAAGLEMEPDSAAGPDPAPEPAPPGEPSGEPDAQPVADPGPESIAEPASERASGDGGTLPPEADVMAPSEAPPAEREPAGGPAPADEDPLFPGGRTRSSGEGSDSGRRTRLLVLLLVVVLGAAILGWYFGAVTIPGLPSPEQMGIAP